MYGYMKLAAKPKRVPPLRRVDSCPLVTVSPVYMYCCQRRGAGSRVGAIARGKQAALSMDIHI